MQYVWDLTSKAGLRPVSWLSVYYTDTFFCFDVSKQPGVRGHVALTIDDGLCRQEDAGQSMADEVGDLLKRHGANATFFLCSDYVREPRLEEQARRLVADGNELGNHCARDREYASLSADAFEQVFNEANDSLGALLGEGERVRWFRAPQGRYTHAMRDSVRQAGMQHALGDAYCDDWMKGSDPEWIARTLLNQLRDGSIVIIHMPERGFRQWLYRALQLLLEGLAARELRAVTLSKLASLAEQEGAAESATPEAPPHGPDGAEG